MAEAAKMKVVIDDLSGKTVREYEGFVTDFAERPMMVQIEAEYHGDPHELGEARIEPGDRVVIRFYEDRLYNVVWIFDHRNHEFEGWYCNFIRPPQFEDARIHAHDLALALHVRPDEDGSLVVNRDEFEALDIPQRLRDDVEDALATLMQAAKESLPPFGTDVPTMRPADRSMPGPEENLPKDPKRDIELNDPRTDQPLRTED